MQTRVGMRMPRSRACSGATRHLSRSGRGIAMVQVGSIQRHLTTVRYTGVVLLAHIGAVYSCSARLRLPALPHYYH